MKAGIHPAYEKALITCACGRVTETRSTVGELHVEICSHCHPFFTGRQKLVDTAGRVERFIAKYGIEEGEAVAQTEAGSVEIEAEAPVVEAQVEADDAGTDDTEGVDEESGATVDV